MLGSSKAVNAACLAVFDPSTNSALSRQIEIDIFVLKSGFTSERLMFMCQNDACEHFEDSWVSGGALS